jgi:hypothetical protein
LQVATGGFAYVFTNVNCRIAGSGKGEFVIRNGNFYDCPLTIPLKRWHFNANGSGATGYNAFSLPTVIFNMQDCKRLFIFAKKTDENE